MTDKVNPKGNEKNQRFRLANQERRNPKYLIYTIEDPEIHQISELHLHRVTKSAHLRQSFHCLPYMGKSRILGLFLLTRANNLQKTPEETLRHTWLLLLISAAQQPLGARGNPLLAPCFQQSAPIPKPLTTFRSQADAARSMNLGREDQLQLALHYLTSPQPAR